ncbi:MAG: SipW-dependent-type signal peptide-containing protein [Clostridia bacterium]|nr:SipW-dependent-type signal peptide-containing protein [Clostridia bacterium]
MKKQRIFLAAILACCLALAGTGTYAFFTAQETAYNVITTGELVMDLVETHDGAPWPEEGVGGVMPGDVIDKRVTVQNLGGVEFYTRARVHGEITLENGETETLTLDQIDLDFNDEAWIDGEDGFYYYHRSLKPRGADGVIDETEPLFTAVTFRCDLGDAYQSARFDLVVETEAVQTKNNGTGPLDAAGWTLKTEVIE